MKSLEWFKLVPFMKIFYFYFYENYSKYGHGHLHEMWSNLFSNRLVPILALHMYFSNKGMDEYRRMHFEEDSITRDNIITITSDVVFSFPVLVSYFLAWS